MKLPSNFKKNISTLFTTLIIFTGLFCTNKSASAGMFSQKTDIEVIKLIEQTKKDKKTFLAVADVHNVDTPDLFFKINSKIFKYPKYCIYANLNGFLECQMDLRWINQNKITWIIKGFTSSKIKSISKNVILSAIKDYLIPYWDGTPGTQSVVDCIPHRHPKEFNVYYT